jgi:nitroreductase
MDTYLTIASRRETRDYADRPLPGESVERILDAGRLAGSSQNKQPWTFVIVESPDRREALAEAVYVPDNVRNAQLVVAIVVSGKGPTSFDAGRAAQNMLLTAWSEGIGSVPNGIKDEARAREVLGLGDDDKLPIVLTFGYPARPRDVESRSAHEWSRRAKRKALDEVVRRI